jgi:tetratricopeptide (TPR) repeat protein
MYYNHNIHMLAASYVGSGNYARAIKAASDLEANVGPNVAAMPMLEMFMPYRFVTLIRFHKADEIMKYPQPPASMKIQTGFWRFARGLALAEIGRAGDADRELIELRALIKSFPPGASIGNNTAEAVFTPALEMLTGEIALAKGDRASAVESLKRAVAAEDLVNYNEPPDLDIPVREWLGRANLRSGRFAEAEEAYRSEIAKHPRNGRALFGLAEALTKQGKASAAALVAREFERAWANSDTKLTVDELYGKSAPTTAATKTGENR